MDGASYVRFDYGYSALGAPRYDHRSGHYHEGSHACLSREGGVYYGRTDPVYTAADILLASIIAPIREPKQMVTEIVKVGLLQSCFSVFPFSIFFANFC